MSADRQPSGNSPLYDGAKARISSSMVGFLDISDPPRRFPCLGSGTLARIGTVCGIVTAAHVSEGLRRPDQVVGLAQFVGARQQAAKLSMEHVRDVTLGNPPWIKDGPDLAFLVLPPDVAA